MRRYIQQFLNAKATKSAKTVENYRSTLNLLGQHSGYAWPLTSDHIDSFLADCVSRELSASSVHKYWREVKAFCRWCEKRDKLNPNPIILAERPPTPRPLPRVPKEEHINTLFAYLRRALTIKRPPGHTAETWIPYRDLAMFALMLDGGLRNGEICTLELRDLDLPGRAVTLRDTKTNFDGVSYFSDLTAKYLTTWLEQRETLPLSADYAYVFVSQPNHHRPEYGHFTPWGIDHILRRVCQRAGLGERYITPHALRHAAAVLSLRGGASLQDVQRQLRHRNMTMTLRYLMTADAGRRERQQGFSPAARIEALR